MEHSDISFEIITLLNPSNEPFPIIYDNKLFRTIPPQKAIRLPKKPFGDLALKHLIDRMLNLENKPTNDPIGREKWRSKIVINEDQDSSDKPLDQKEVLQRKLDRLNQTNDSGSIQTCPTCSIKVFNLEEHILLNHATVTPEAVSAVNVEVVDGIGPDMTAVDTLIQQPKPTSDVLDKALASKREDAMVLPAQDATEEVAPVQEQPKVEPTREELITYARDTLKMNVSDPKTKELLDTSSIEQLKQELRYGI